MIGAIIIMFRTVMIIIENVDKKTRRQKGK
jgi:hypothetical protein